MASIHLGFTLVTEGNVVNSNIESVSLNESY